MKSIVDVIGLFVMLAVVAVLARNPEIVRTFFSGVQGTIGTAIKG